MFAGDYLLMDIGVLLDLLARLLGLLDAAHVASDLGLDPGVGLGGALAAHGLGLRPHLDVVDRLPNQLGLRVVIHIVVADFRVLAHQSHAICQGHLVLKLRLHHGLFGWGPATSSDRFLGTGHSLCHLVVSVWV